MKTLQVMAGAKHGGAETAFVDMCLAMHEVGQTVEVVTRSNAVRVPQLRHAGIRVHTLPFGQHIDVYTRWAMKRIIRAFQPQIVQTWMARAADHTPQWDASMGVPEYPVVARLGSYYKMKHYTQTQYFVGIAPMICDYLIGNGIDKERVRQISNFAETSACRTRLDRSEHGVPEDAPLILALGRLHEVKALDVLIKAVAQVPDVHCLIAGEGPLRRQFETLIDDLGVADRVRLLGWRTDRAELFEMSDICVFPSRFEPFGTVFVQAWGHDTPLIVSNADGPRQFVRDGEDGIIFPIDDVDALRAAIIRLKDDSDLRKSFVSKGRERYEAEFTKAQCVQNYLSFYQDIIN